MNKSTRNNLVAGAAAAGLLSLAPAAYAEGQDQPPEGMPFKHGKGYELFQENCAECHGAGLDGTDQGPPLLHGYYKPGHHADFAIFRAIEQGTPQHHWNFGDMEPVEGVDRQQAGAIVEFIRWFQQKEGLY